MTTLEKTDDTGNYSAIEGYLSQAGNWMIDLIVQRLGAYDLNRSFDATIGASTSHDNMDMSADMNMEMQENMQENTSSLGTTNNNAQEAGSASPSPALDSFAWLAIGL